MAAQPQVPQYDGTGARATLVEVLSTLNDRFGAAQSRTPSLVEVTAVHADRSVRAYVDGDEQDVSLNQLDAWMRADVTIRPFGGWSQ